VVKHLALIMLVVLAGCGGSKQVVDTTSAEVRFEKAKALFDKEDYLDAINEFQAITLQFPGATLADDAQYYLAECHFKRGEYILAAYEYQELKRSYAASPLVPDAQFKLGMCYYELSPSSKLDQQYTVKARDELQAFVEYYPSNDSAVSAARYIEELTDRLAKKKFETAQLYSIMEYYRAAVIYYDDVIENYHDTQYAPPAYIGKIKALIARNKYRDASLEVNKFISTFPNSVFRGQADDLKKRIDNALGETPDAASSRGLAPPETHQQLQ
jgi:outer membrane protein assembly factor BamD